MLATLRRIPWFRVLTWILGTTWNVLVWAVEQIAHLVHSAAGSFFGVVVKGSVTAVLIKVAAVLLLLGFAAVALKLEQFGAELMMLAMLPIMLLGLWVIIKSVFAPAKKKKKKK
ncbi:hypothetical protein A2949_00455 [Candidatus Adlerbacteria bacterium RIFCSPLOWO2_01_FULL_54_21b]|uniref:Uncharacterized protein n=1 Tax=Candidatus Adlerbacteria bacterium RIFCSPLOWO2_01_FULL_54_21b TaxID=1797245 RepID=A0A1F4Y1F5_9BACT|nr:MAG: hypothetical protein A2949_00455 [Candidatus Adlerbacteria bacterium RIFCSPLOWO2_01_FULL_54_21b]